MLIGHSLGKLDLVVATKRLGVLLLGLSISGCGDPRASLGGFEDDAGETGSTPPDLPTLECLPREFDTCGPDRKCMFVRDAGDGPLARCVPLLGEGKAGDPCTLEGESDTCAEGRLCWAIDPATEVGTCVDNCGWDLSCDDPTDTCIVGNEGVLAICLDACDPLDASTCAEGFGCYDSASGRWACDRDYSGDDGAHGSPCECMNCCDPGLVCVPAAFVDDPACALEGATGCCAEVCRLPEDDEPDPECPTELERCRAYYDADQVLMGYEHVGVCRR